LIGLATGVPVEFLSVGGPPDSTLSDIATAFLDANTFLDEVDNPPSVVTTSFGLMESLFESSVSKSAFHGPESFPSIEYFAGSFVTVTWP
jgi:tripeptidyl-peptidase-1